MAVKLAANVAQRDQLGQRMLEGGLQLAWFSRSSGGIQSMPSSS